MAQLLLITEKALSVKDNRQVSDIVGVFDDSHVFSSHEKEVFDIVKIPDDPQTLNQTMVSKACTVFRAKTTDWTTDIPEEKQAWKDSSGNWNEIVEKPRFNHRYENGAVKENYSRITANTETVLVQKESVVTK